MSNSYTPTVVPDEYDPVFLHEELQRIAIALGGIEVPFLILEEQHTAPAKVYEGMVIIADGTDWNPGTGQGVYARVGGAWVKL